MNDYKEVFLSENIEKNLESFKEIFKNDSILRVRTFGENEKGEFLFGLFYMDGMVDTLKLNDFVIKPLLTLCDKPGEDFSLYIERQVLFASDVKKSGCYANIIGGLLYGEAVLFVRDSDKAFNIDLKGWERRGIKEPEDERVLQGPREGFQEAALSNLAMIRRKLQTPDLCFEKITIGRRSATAVFICYLSSLTDKKLLADLKEKLNRIDIDGILDSNYLNEIINSGRFSLFKTCGTTERPDVAASKLLEGRIALVVDGTPMVLTLPYFFSENFQSDEDYYVNFLAGSKSRMLRCISFVVSFFVPALFIAIYTFHKELMPTSLAILISQLRGNVPFSPLSECLVLIFIFEVLKETGMRMAQGVGHALSIVGGLVVGQAAVDAGIISTPMLIVVALSGISGLMIPKLRVSIFYLRLIFITLAAMFGLFGMILGSFWLTAHIISLSTFNESYTIYLKKADFQSLKDVFIRAPWPKMIKRPEINSNIIRQKVRLK